MIGRAVRHAMALCGVVLLAFAAPVTDVAAATAPTPAPAVPRNDLGYRLAVPPWAFSFPRDHASHPDFQTEWWYYTGHLSDGGRRFGFELTFFRVGLNRDRRASESAWAPHTLHFAHLALTDEQGKRFRFEERISRGALGSAGADSTHYHVWIDDWSARLAADGRTHELRAPGAEFQLSLDLQSEKRPALHGANGVSQKSAGVGRASHYYSLTRMTAGGTITLEGRTLPVRGEAWMDHEFSSAGLAPGQTGWDWFSLQLDDGRELMLYVLRLKGGGIEPLSSGTLIERDGRTTHLPLAAFRITPTARWTSPHSGAEYPAAWRIELPDQGLDLRLTPTLADQELALGGTLGIVYWEGAVRIDGRARGAPVQGRGYVELTGYAGRAPGVTGE